MTSARFRPLIRAGALTAALALAGSSPLGLAAQSRASTRTKGVQLSPSDMRDWLTYLSSDQLQGRQIFTEGYGLAAAYVADHLKEWGVKPFGEEGTYFQTVQVKGYRVTRRSSVTVDVGGETRTFKDGDHVTFPANAGGPQTLTIAGAEFVGAGLVVSESAENDYAGRDVRGKVAVWMGNGPGTLPAAAARLLAARAQYATETMGARTSIGYAPSPTPAEVALVQARAALTEAQAAVTAAQQALVQSRTGGRGGGGRGNVPATPPDFTTVQRLDGLVPPQFTGDDDFFRFLLRSSPTTFADLKAKADKREPLPTFALEDVTITVNIDNVYDVVSTQLSKNVLGVVEGTDPVLKRTYVVFGAHLDHVGYRTAPAVARGGRAPDEVPDLIFNGADDDGSGVSAEMAIAKAFASRPKPKRSVVFVWHTGEEAGLLGSRYNADFPAIPLDSVQCQLNIDMVGRNADNDPKNADQVFVVGDDRISTGLHNVIVDANARLPQPLRLDYSMNDAGDPQRIYYRSDHYSYAAKGIPIAFFTTGLHPDYHQPSDTVDKILFDKMARIAQLVYETGWSVANTGRVLERDNRGPRSGKGFTGKIEGP